MKNLYFTFVAAGLLVGGLGSCSSSTTDTGTTSTAEVVTTDQTAARSQAEVVAKVPVPANNETTTAYADSTSFQSLAASTDMFEVLSSVQARSKAQNAEVKKFAEQMLTDHTKTSEELKQIASKRNLTLPTTPLAAHQRMLNKLTNEEDADEFDDEYMGMQLTVHKQAVELFESASRSQTDPELKAFAARHLPHLRSHQEMAKRLKDQVK